MHLLQPIDVCIIQYSTFAKLQCLESGTCLALLNLQCTCKFMNMHKEHKSIGSGDGRVKKTVATMYVMNNL